MKRFFMLSQAEYILNRNRLNCLFRESSQSNIISIVAGAGYGKTQSVLSYAANSDSHVIWISFTRLDNYPVHFWDTFCSVLSTVNPNLAQYLLEQGFPSDYQMLYQSIKRITAAIYQDKPYILVFDDCHLITNPTVQDFVRTLIFSDIENISVFLLSRSPFFISKGPQSNGHSIIQLTEADLAFTDHEISEYFSLLEIPVPQDIIAKILEKSEGWPIAVYLLTVGIRENPHLLEHSHNLINSLVYDVIEKEIFSLHSEEEQRFFIQLSLLDTCPTQMLRDVYGKELLTAVNTNLLIRYNQYTDSYHFHQLFRDFLAHKTKKLTDAEKKETYCNAAKWYRRKHMLVDTLNCYRKIGDYENIWDICQEAVISQNLYTPENAYLMIDILQSMPQAFIDAHPKFQIVLAFFHIQVAQYDKASELFLSRIQDLESKQENPETRSIIGESIFQNSMLNMLKGDTGFTEEMKKARRYLKSGSVLIEQKKMILLNGDPVTLKTGRAGEMSRWTESLMRCAEDFNALTKNNTNGFDKAACAQAAYYQGNMPEAELYAQKALYEAKQYNCVDIVGCAYYLLMKINMYRGDYTAVTEAIDQNFKYSRSYNWCRQYNIPDICKGFFYTQIEQLARVPEWIVHDSIYAQSLSLSNYGLERVLKANYLLRQKRYYELFPFLEQSDEFYRKNNRYISRIYIHIIRAIAQSIMGDVSSMYREFVVSYQMACQNNLIMPFVEFGKYMRTMIEEIRKLNAGDIPTDWLDSLQAKSSTYAKRLSAIEQEYLSEHQSNVPNLTDKEILVLKNLAQGLTRDEISENMDISTNTVKSLLKSIYGKLGAINGFHAVKIASTNGIV